MKVPTPAAMEGEQFEVWGVDEAPLPAEMIAKQERLIPVACRLCATLMYAREQYLGRKATCPDCGTKTVIVLPKPEPAVGPVGVPDGEEYQLDPESAPTPRPVPKPVALRHAEVRETSRKAAEERENAGRKRKKKKRAALREQPVKFPLVQRLPAMLLTASVFSRWVILSLCLVVAAWFGSFGAGEASSKFHAVAMVCFFVVAVILGLLWLAAAAALWLAILTESADGHDELHHPPSTNLPDWFRETAYLAVAATASAVPAAALDAYFGNRRGSSGRVGRTRNGNHRRWLATEFPDRNSLIAGARLGAGRLLAQTWEKPADLLSDLAALLSRIDPVDARHGDCQRMACVETSTAGLHSRAVVVRGNTALLPADRTARLVFERVDGGGSRHRDVATFARTWPA